MNHRVSAQHREAVALVQTKFFMDDAVNPNEMVKVPLLPKAVMYHYVETASPVKFARICAVVDAIKFGAVQIHAQRGGSKEGFWENYKEYFAVTRDRDLHVGDVQAWIIFMHRCLTSNLWSVPTGVYSQVPLLFCATARPC